MIKYEKKKKRTNSGVMNITYRFRETHDRHPAISKSSSHCQLARINTNTLSVLYAGAESSTHIHKSQHK